MSEVVAWLSANPQLWVVPAVLVSSGLGVTWSLRRVRRRPVVVDVSAAWRSMSTAAQAAHDEAVLDAAEAAELAAARASSLYRS
jgi:cytochrome c-type biogenesis protein CcmH/NrfF